MKKESKFITQKQFYQEAAERWNLRDGPSRPSQETVQHYNALVKLALGKGKNQKVMILGATPEIRDLLYKYYFLKKIKVGCVEWLPVMYYGMSQLINFKIPGERHIKKDWLKMDFPKNSIDLFIGDLVFGNITTREKKEKLLSLIQQRLKNKGYFITRHAYITPRVKIANIKKYLYSFVPAVLNEKLTIKQAATSFYVDLVLASWYRNKENKLSLVYYLSELKSIRRHFKRKNLSNNDIIAKLIFEHFQRLGNIFSRKYWVYYPKQEEERILKKFFIIEKRLFTKDYHSAANTPIYCLKPKK